MLNLYLVNTPHISRNIQEFPGTTRSVRWRGRSKIILCLYLLPVYHQCVDFRSQLPPSKEFGRCPSHPYNKKKLNKLKIDIWSGTQGRTEVTRQIVILKSEEGTIQSAAAKTRSPGQKPLDP